MKRFVQRRAAFAAVASLGAAVAGTLPGLEPVAHALPVTQAVPAVPRAGGFNPVSITFVSLRTGWALGAIPCRLSGQCVALERTTNAGASWTARPLPAGLRAEVNRRGSDAMSSWVADGSGLNVRFANPRDGWIYGDLPAATGVRAVLWATHNGGSTWEELHPLGGPNPNIEYLDVEAMGPTVYLMGVNSSATANGAPGASVESALVGSDRWQRDPTPQLPLPAGGAQPTGSFIFQGGRGWLVEGNDRGISGSARLATPGRWAPWTPPCGSVGDSYTVPAAADARHLVAVCVMGGFAYPLAKSAPRGATLGSSWLYVSSNGGASFGAGPELSNGRVGSPYYGGVLASPRAGVVLSGRSGKVGELAGSFDGGRHWAGLYVGDFFYLGFTSASQGVGLVSSGSGSGSGTGTGTATAMVMTFDGGHAWHRVSF